jgi:hypothetical protein
MSRIDVNLDLPPIVELEDDQFEAIQDFFETQGWSDGLPFVPPTEERVASMYRYLPGRSPGDVIATLAPRNGEATLERIAVNAVMAGCRPEYMPVLVTAVQAIAEEPFNLNGIQSTTHPCAAFVLVNGPVARELAINGGYNCFGPGWRANATIGRALRLVLWNVGGGIPGGGDRATQGTPAKYTYCIAENEEENPWTPLHVELGFGVDDSTVTVMAAEAPHNIQDHGSVSGASILHTIAGSLREMGSNQILMSGGQPLIVLGPEHAATIARDGYSKDDVKQYIWEHARLRLDECAPDWAVPGGHIERMRLETGQVEVITVAEHWTRINVIVAGGAGKHSCWLPTFGRHTNTVTRRIELANGDPVQSIYAIASSE